MNKHIVKMECAGLVQSHAKTWVHSLDVQIASTNANLQCFITVFGHRNYAVLMAALSTASSHARFTGPWSYA